MPRHGLSLILTLWLGCQGWAQPLRLEMLKEPLTAQEETYVVGALEWIRGVYQGWGLSPSHHLKARIFGQFPEFQAYQKANRSFQDGSQPSRSGYYSLGQQELVTWRFRGLKALMIHEGQHALLRSSYPRPPKWLNEGLSECFEGFDFSQVPPQVKAQGPRLRKLKALFTDDLGRQLLDVLQLEESEFNRLAQDPGLDSYTRSWALVYFLWSQPSGQQKLGELLQALARGEDAEEFLCELFPGAPLEEQICGFYREHSDPPPRTAY